MNSDEITMLHKKADIRTHVYSFNEIWQPNTIYHTGDHTGTLPSVVAAAAASYGKCLKTIDVKFTVFISEKSNINTNTIRVASMQGRMNGKKKLKTY